MQSIRRVCVVSSALMAAVVLWFAAAGNSYAQEARGSIQGRVLDSASAVIPGAELRVTNVAKGTSVQVTTNDEGNYRVPYLLPGVYRISAGKTGFKSTVRENVELRLADNLTIDLVLEVGEVSQVVDVRDSTPLLEESTASLGLDLYLLKNRSGASSALFESHQCASPCSVFVPLLVIVLTTEPGVCPMLAS